MNAYLKIAIFTFSFYFGFSHAQNFSLSANVGIGANHKNPFLENWNDGYEKVKAGPLLCVYGAYFPKRFLFALNARWQKIRSETWYGDHDSGHSYSITNQYKYNYLDFAFNFGICGRNKIYPTLLVEYSIPIGGNYKSQFIGTVYNSASMQFIDVNETTINKITNSPSLLNVGIGLYGRKDFNNKLGINFAINYRWGLLDSYFSGFSNIHLNAFIVETGIYYRFQKKSK